MIRRLLRYVRCLRAASYRARALGYEQDARRAVHGPDRAVWMAIAGEYRQRAADLERRA